MESVEIYKASFARVQRTEASQGDFFEAFYDQFLGSSPDIAARFTETNMVVQRIHLRRSFAHMLGLFVEGKPSELIEEIGTSHGKKGLNIPNWMYDNWLNALVSTAKAFDPQFGEAEDAAWRTVFEPGTSFMKSV